MSKHLKENFVSGQKGSVNVYLNPGKDRKIDKLYQGIEGGQVFITDGIQKENTEFEEDAAATN